VERGIKEEEVSLVTSMVKWSTSGFFLDRGTRSAEGCSL